MTRKDCILLAAAVNAMSLTQEQRKHVAVVLANKLAEDNTRFDYDKFVTTCMNKETR